MTYANIDTNILSHDKILRAGEDAADLYIRSLIRSGQLLTDGYVSVEALEQLSKKRARRANAARLVEVGLWIAVDGGWQIHSYLDHNKSREEVLAIRAELSAKRAEAGKKGGLASGEKRRGKGAEQPPAEGSNGEAMAKQLAPKQGSKPEAPVEALCTSLQVSSFGEGENLPARTPTRGEPPTDAPPPPAVTPETPRPPSPPPAVPARAPVVPATPPPAAVAPAYSEPPSGEYPTAAGATEVRAPNLTGLRVMEVLRKRSGLRLSVGLNHIEDLDRLMPGWSPPVTLPAVERLGDHLNRNHTRDGWTPTGQYLRTAIGDWSNLQSMLDEAAQCSRCDEADAAERPPEHVGPTTVRALALVPPPPVVEDPVAVERRRKNFQDALAARKAAEARAERDRAEELAHAYGE